MKCAALQCDAMRAVRHERRFIHANYASLPDDHIRICTTLVPCIFTRLGLEFTILLLRIPAASGGTGSHEFQCWLKSGEDVIANSDTSDSAAPISSWRQLCRLKANAAAQAELTKVHTPNVKTIESLV